MKPLGLDWLQSATIGEMLIARRGVFKCFVWESADRGVWVWEIDIADQPVTMASGFAHSEQKAKDAADQYLRAVGNAILGDGAK